MILFFLSLCLVAMASGSVGWWLAHSQETGQETLLSPLIPAGEKPLLAYTISALSQRPYQTSPIQVEKVLESTPDYTGYLFSYTTVGKRMTGLLNVPTQLDPSTVVPTVVMLRGYVPPEIYQTGVGTRNAGRVLASHGFITIAPDFFGYGESDPEPSDTWQARFEKPLLVIELIKSLQAAPIMIETKKLDINQVPLSVALTDQTLNIGKIGLWGHSNGGQIALTTLEILNTAIPTTLWAPVTAPFPYSILFFSDENLDEGKETRKWLSLFEREYDVFDFSLTQHLNRLHGPLQLHHGTADEAALQVWSDEFLDKVKQENQRRRQDEARVATGAAQASPELSTDQIEFTYYTYPGADHNLQPGWDTVVARDLEFFRKYLLE